MNSSLLRKRGGLYLQRRHYLWWAFAILSIFFLLGTTAFAHGVAEGDKGYIKEISGVNILPFIYLGAKHMFTGYDHIRVAIATEQKATPHV